MKIGVVKEIKLSEDRVALTPAGARELCNDGQDVVVETGAGAGSGFSDDAYEGAGAQLVDRASVWSESDLVVKVKEPVADEYEFLRPGLTLFTFLHLAANPSLTEALLRSAVCAIAYETVQDREGRLPLLLPMSEIAGRLATQAGAFFLQGPAGGEGVLLGGAPGVAPARVLVIGGGTAGTHAARVAVGMGAEVTLLERSLERIKELDELFGGRVRVLFSDAMTVEAEAELADLLIGAVLIPGARAPHLVDRQTLAMMKPGSVIVDVAIDQGGCVETSRATTHAQPTYTVDEVVHYCVANMPGAVPRTSTRALTNATLPYVKDLASLGIDEAVSSDPGLRLGVNVKDGEVVSTQVARAYGDSTGAAVC